MTPGPNGSLSLEERYALLADHVTDMISLHDRDGVFLYVSPSTRDILGWDPRTLVGRSAFDLVHPEDRDAVTRSLDAVRRGHDVADVTSRMRRKDGGWTWVETRSKMVRDASGRVDRIVATSRDVTGRKRTERRLAESEARFRSAFEDAGIGMALLSLDGRWLKVNRSVCELTGYPETELLQKTFQDLTHPDDLDSDLELLGRTLAGDLAGYDLEKRYFHADGHLIWAHLTVSLVRGVDGEPLYFVSQIQDITERRRALTELRGALAEVQQLEGLLPICSHCKSIRSEAGDWQRLEDYLDQRSDVTFSHGICPGCEERYFPE